jgi:hypothetical protein
MEQIFRDFLNIFVKKTLCAYWEFGAVEGVLLLSGHQTGKEKEKSKLNGPCELQML